MAKQSEIAELVIYLRGCLDEAEQFSNHIDTLIRGCKKGVLLDVMHDMYCSAKDNLEIPSRNHYIVHDIGDVELKIKQIEQILNQ